MATEGVSVERADFKEQARCAVTELLASSEGAKLLEASLLNFALERKAGEAIDRYLLSRVFPGVVVIAAVLGYFGWSVSSARSIAEEQFRSVVEQKKAIELELERVRSAVDAARVKVMHLEQQAIATQEHLKSEADNQRRGVERSSDMARLWASETHQRIQREAESLAKLSDRVVDGEARVNELRRRADTVEEMTALGLKKAESLATLADLQGRVIGSAVIEYIILRSRTRSSMIELPRRVGSYRLQFEVPNIKDEFELGYRLDGLEHRLTVSNADKATWQPIIGTEGLYEFRVDHVFHGPGAKVPDFVALRVRTSGSLVGVEAGQRR